MSELICSDLKLEDHNISSQIFCAVSKSNIENVLWLKTWYETLQRTENITRIDEEF